jgi:hypothetical protein
MPVPVALDSSQIGTLLPGPGIFRFTFVLGSDPTYFLTSQPLDGQPLEDFLQQLVAAVTNLPPNMVRPRWQEEPPTLPAHNVDWCATGMTSSELDNGWPYVNFDQVDGQAYMQQHETVELLTSCYGPHAEWFSGLIRDGFMIGQNREVLYLASMGLIGVGRAVVAPELINKRWLRRVDRIVRIHRLIRRAYPILSLLSAPFGVGVEEFKVYQQKIEVAEIGVEA